MLRTYVIHDFHRFKTKRIVGFLKVLHSSQLHTNLSSEHAINAFFYCSAHTFTTFACVNLSARSGAWNFHSLICMNRFIQRGEYQTYPSSFPSGTHILRRRTYLSHSCEPWFLTELLVYIFQGTLEIYSFLNLV